MNLIFYLQNILSKSTFHWTSLVFTHSEVFTVFYSGVWKASASGAASSCSSHQQGVVNVQYIWKYISKSEAWKIRSKNNTIRKYGLCRQYV